jgi:TonB-dependent SusC/RagA subfamily outer membrane receptor
MKTKILLILLLSFITITLSNGQKSTKKITVTGLVTDSQNNPITGALILIDNMSSQKVTNNKGLYKIKVKPDADSISVFTLFNGVSTSSIEGRTTINFTLVGITSSKENSQNLSGKDEVVNIGYGNVKQKDLLTPVNKIDARSIKYASYNSIFEILKGTPGVLVSGNSIQIQGQSSINSGTEPLFVVDGMVVGSIDNISPSMVESITVLKGAATSIYGSRGANGVILIKLIGAPEIK